jgi:hypothetical protein
MFTEFLKRVEVGSPYRSRVEDLLWGGCPADACIALRAAGLQVDFLLLWIPWAFSGDDKMLA